MDKLYIGDIPSEYCYSVFGNNYIDLYKQENLQGNLDFYRVYLYDHSFFYEHKFVNYANDSTTIATLIQTTNDWYYRRDMPSIMFMSVVEICIIVIIINLITSVFKKGGLLSGLL